MHSKVKKIFLLVLGLFLIAFTVFGCDEKEQINWDSDQPKVAYMRLQKQVGGRYFYCLGVGTFEGNTQINSDRCIALSLGTQEDVVFYEIYKKGVNTRNSDLYILNNKGESMLFAEDIGFYLLGEGGHTITYNISKTLNFVFMEYTPEGDVVSEDLIENDIGVYSTEMNSKGDILLLGMFRDENDDDYSWANIYLYKDGQKKKIVDNAYLSLREKSVSNEGTVLYITDAISANDDERIGTLYRKTLDGDAIKVVEASTREFTISNDGELVVSVVKDKDGNETLFYQYVGQDPVYVENIVQYEMSRDSNILYYAVGDTSDWELELYKVKKGTKPELVTDNIAKIAALSLDGKCVAFLTNIDSSTELSDLYIAREGEEQELVDSGVPYSEYNGKMLDKGVELNNDGTTIAYRKNNDDSMFAYLYVKQEGEPPVLIDKDVIDFIFLR